MKKLLVLLLLFPLYLFSLELEAEYEISYGLFGKLGVANTKIYRDDKKYIITAKAETTGFARVLSGNRKELHESSGRVINGVLYPDVYKKVRSTNRYIKEKRYVFDHKNKKVLMFKEEFYHDDEKRNKSTKEEFPYYARDDILSLYFNLGALLKDDDSKKYEFFAVGSKEKNGKIDVSMPEGDELQKMKKDMKQDTGTFLKVRVNQKIFTSENGDMLINMAKDGTCNKAVLQNVLIFGDVVAKKINLKVISE